MPLVDALTVTAPRSAPRQARRRQAAARCSSDFEPAGDQPTAIDELVAGIRAGRAQPGAARRHRHRQDLHRGQDHRGDPAAGDHPRAEQDPGRPALRRIQVFFPENAVEYFVSYYDYYQPEAYVARTDTYIEKESQINEQIDRMRHSATRALLERDDVIIVASVSCIYGIGSAETYGAMTQDLIAGQRYDQRQVIAAPDQAAVPPQRRRLPARRLPGARRFAGALAGALRGPRLAALSFFGEELESIHEFDPLTGARTGALDRIRVYANSHYVTPRPTLQQAIKNIRDRAAPAPRPARGRRQAARGAAPRAAHHLRPRDDRGDRLLRRHRELFALPHGPQTRRAAPYPLRVHPRQRHRLRRREPRLGPADRRHVQGRLPPQVHPRRVRLPPALLHGQPPAQVRGMGRHAPAVGLRLGHPRPPGRSTRPAASSPSR